MKRPLVILCLICLFAMVVYLLPACAPAPGMAATLTMLPGTFTPTRPKIVHTPTITPTRTPIPFDISMLTGTPASCAAFTTDLTGSVDPAQSIGRRYDPANLPKVFQPVASGELASSNLRWTQVDWHGRQLYWLEKQVCQEGPATAYWQIVDALALPQLNSTDQTTIDTCYLNGQKMPAVIGYGTYDPSHPASVVTGGVKGWPVQVQAVWQIQNTFVPLDPQGLTCLRLANRTTQ